MKNILYMDIISAFKWYKVIGKRFIDIVPLYTFGIIFFTILSQLLILLASILPLKVIILLGTDKIPRYFPNSLQLIDKNSLIILLAISAAVFYLFHLISEKKVTSYAITGSDLILKNNKKVAIYENQNMLASKAYGLYAKSLSKYIFTLITLITLAFIYPFLLFILFAYAIGVVTFLIFRSKNNLFYELLNKKTSSILLPIGGIGFLIIFSSILYSYLYDFLAPNLIIAIIGILLVRQTINQLVSAILSTSILYKDRIKINALFFYQNFKIDNHFKKIDDFWNLFDKVTINELADDILKNTIGETGTVSDIQWYGLNIRDIAMFRIKFIHNNQIDTFLIKFFNKNITSKAIHEEIFLNEASKLSFVPLFIGSTIVQQFPCHIFRDNGIKIAPVANISKDTLEIKKELLITEPSKELIQRYRRSHALLWQRLDYNIFKKLKLIADDIQINDILKLEHEFEKLLLKLSKFPLQIISNNRRMNSILSISNNDNLQILHWSEWKIEPIGADWPTNKQALDYLNTYLSINNPKQFKNITINHIKLSALMSKFEKLSISQNFTELFNLLPMILECIQLLENEIIREQK